MPLTTVHTPDFSELMIQEILENIEDFCDQHNVSLRADYQLTAETVQSRLLDNLDFMKNEHVIDPNESLESHLEEVLEDSDAYSDGAIFNVFQEEYINSVLFDSSSGDFSHENVDDSILTERT